MDTYSLPKIVARLRRLTALCAEVAVTPARNIKMAVAALKDARALCARTFANSRQML